MLRWVDWKSTLLNGERNLYNHLFRVIKSNIVFSITPNVAFGSVPVYLIQEIRIFNRQKNMYSMVNLFQVILYIRNLYILKLNQPSEKTMRESLKYKLLSLSGNVKGIREEPIKTFIHELKIMEIKPTQKAWQRISSNLSYIKRIDHSNPEIE
jgi:hypothetical protein